MSIQEQTLSIDQLIGKTITDVRCKYGKQDGWLDTADCYLALDDACYIEIPYGEATEVALVDPPADAATIFGDGSTIPVYQVNPTGKTIAEILAQQRSLFHRIRQAFSGNRSNAYQPYRAGTIENKLHTILHRTIVDYLWDREGNDKGFLELDNGGLISDQYMAPHGTGLAGLHYYKSIQYLQEMKDLALLRYSEQRSKGDSTL